MMGRKIERRNWTREKPSNLINNQKLSVDKSLRYLLSMQNVPTKAQSRFSASLLTILASG